MRAEKQHKSGHGSQPGYTLLELLFAVAIVAVLAVVAISAYTGSMDRARNRKAVADIAELELVIERYCSDHFALPDTLPASRSDPWGNP